MNEKLLGGFEERLLATLRTQVQSPAATGGGGTKPHRTPRRLLAAVAVAALAVGLPTALSGSSNSPAFAVESDGDGIVTVDIHRLTDAAGLEQQLAANGINARVDYTPSGKTCKMPRFTPAPDSPLTAWARDPDSTTFGDGNIAFKLRSSDLLGHTLVIMIGPDGIRTVPESTSVRVEIGLADGPVAACELVDTADQPMPSYLVGEFFAILDKHDGASSIGGTKGHRKGGVRPA